MKLVFFVALGALMSLGCDRSVGGSTPCTVSLSDCEAAPLHRVEYVLDAQNRPVSSVNYVGGNDEPAVCIAFRYDDAGRLVEQRNDLQCDGSDDYGWDIAYDEHNRVTYEREEEAQDCLEQHYRWITLSDTVAVATVARDYDCDGTTDRDLCLRLELDTHGQVVTETFGDCDAPYYCFSYTYDSRGHRTQWAIDDDCDGLPERCTNYHFDQGGVLVSLEDREPCDAARTVCGVCEGSCPDIHSITSWRALPYTR
jgi:YD repeat-containing protein